VSIAAWRDLSVVLLAIEGVIIGLVILAMLVISARLLGMARSEAHVQMRTAQKMMLRTERQVNAATVVVVSPVVNLVATSHGISVALNRLRQSWRRHRTP
jgi:hypothetical protein